MSDGAPYLVIVGVYVLCMVLIFAHADHSPDVRECIEEDECCDRCQPYACDFNPYLLEPCECI